MWLGLLCLFVTGIGVVAFFLASYSKMLERAKTPWFLRSPVGEIILLLLFRSGTFLRQLCPSYIRTVSSKTAKEKIATLDQSTHKLHGICFVGSSTFTYWRCIESDFFDLNIPIINGGFGGSCTGDIIPHVDMLCGRFKPRFIVYFCGTNNVAQGLKAQSAYDGFQQFHIKSSRLCPNAQIFYIAITITPFYLRWNINNSIEESRKANKMVKEYCTRLNDNDLIPVTYVDTDKDCYSFLKDRSSYLGDMHHLNDEGHSMLADILKENIRPLL